MTHIKEALRILLMPNRIIHPSLRKTAKMLVSMTEAQRSGLERLALALGCTLSEAMRRALTEALENRGLDSTTVEN